MTGTVESTHNKITSKIQHIKNALIMTSDLINKCVDELTGNLHNASNFTYDILSKLEGSRINLIIDDFENLEKDYCLSVVDILSTYYNNSGNEEEVTKQFYQIITSENYPTRIDEYIQKAHSLLALIKNTGDASVNIELAAGLSADKLNKVQKQIDNANNIHVAMDMKKSNYDKCKCGEKMVIVPELSELQCPSSTCGRIKVIYGVVFRDD